MKLKAKVIKNGNSWALGLAKGFITQAVLTPGKVYDIDLDLESAKTCSPNCNCIKCRFWGTVSLFNLCGSLI